MSWNLPGARRSGLWIDRRDARRRVRKSETIEYLESAEGAEVTCVSSTDGAGGRNNAIVSVKAGYLRLLRVLQNWFCLSCSASQRLRGKSSGRETRLRPFSSLTPNCGATSGVRSLRPDKSTDP